MTEEKKLVLVVEDNSDNYELVEKILHHYGFATHTVTDGKQALEWCRSHVPDLILMDISLPEINGLDVTRELRTKEEFKNLPIIALTASVMPEDAHKSLAAGCSGHLGKPFRPKALLETVQQYLQKGTGEL